MDYFLVSPNVSDVTVGTGIEPADNLSDHGTAWIELGQTERKRVRGVWRFKNLLLSDPNFLESTNSLIRETILEYTLNKFLTNKTDDSILYTCESTICPILLLELILAKVRHNTVSFSASKCRQKLNIVSDLSHEIKILEE